MVVSYDIRRLGYERFIEYMRNRLGDIEINYDFSCFDRLPEKYIDAICLHFVYGFTFREAGELLCISRSYAHAIPYYAHRILNKNER